MKKNAIFFLLTLLVFSSSCNNKKPVAGRFDLSGNGWNIASSLVVKDGGEALSVPGVKTDGWTDAKVPTTVLRALVDARIYPDPWTGLNNFRIPDVSDEFNSKYDLAKFSHLGNSVNPWKDPWWYRKEFDLPASLNGSRIWLNFDGINYRADVWINGRKIADHGEMAGMFRRFRYDITDYAVKGGKNCVAIMIYQVDHPGLPDPGVQFKLFGKTRGHATEIFRDETLKFSGGWDCAPVIRDRNMGIYEDVYIEASGEVTVNDPFVKTSLSKGDTTLANLDIEATLRNNSKEKVDGELDIRISLINDVEFPTYVRHMDGQMQDIVITRKISLEPSEIKTISLEPSEYPALSVSNPYLWWPNGYGRQYLHKLKISYKTGGVVSDEKSISFGIREVKNELRKVGPEYARTFIINGHKIFCKGGWLQPDAMLNYDRKRIYDEARLLAMANVNMVASEDAPSPPEDVLESYDKYGLMCWETFYQCYRMYPGDVTANNPDDHKLALKEAEDIIKRYRNHPSLVIWCAANEVTVAQDIYDPLREYVFSLDGTRPFIPASSTSWNIEKLTPYIIKDLPLGTTDDGDPDYNWNPERFYFDKILEVKLQTFRNELGVASVPEYSSIRKFIPETSAKPGSQYFPLDSVWAEHGAWDDNGYAFRRYDEAIRTLYGKPASTEDYVRKAQFVNANSYRAMFEAANHRMWTITSGVMLWKLNDCWPSVLWQLYDWYLLQNAAYYYSKSAMEPLHIQLNANTYTVSVINNLKSSPGTLTAEASIISTDLKTSWENSEKADMDSTGYKELFIVPRDKISDPFSFLRLKLKDSKGRVVSENVYWLSKNERADFSRLTGYNRVPLTIESGYEIRDKEYRFNITVKNTTDQLSFFNRMVITRGKDGEEVLPTFWDWNYLVLFPGESKTVQAVVSKDDLKGSEPWLHIEGNNSVTPVKLIMDKK